MNTTKPRTARAMMMSRRGFSLAVALVLGTSFVPSADAAKKVPPVKKRVQFQVDLCETIGHGILTSERVGNSTVTQCTGGYSDGRRCVHTKKSTKCHQTRTVPPGESGEDPGDPPAEEPVFL